MYGRPLRRSTPPGVTPPVVRRRWAQVRGNRVASIRSAQDAADESTSGVPILEAEIRGLRQLLAEVRATHEGLRQEMNDLRRDRDRWENLAKAAGAEKAGARTWFCGRATSGG
jgi:phage shock protein A